MVLTHVRLLVDGFSETFRFYRDVMRFEVLWGDEHGGYADLKAGDGSLVAISDRQIILDAVGSAEGGPDTVMLVFAVESVDEAAAELQSRGAALITQPADRPEWGIRTAHLRDPEGMLIEINTALPTSEWTDELRQEGERYGSQDPK